MAAYECYSRSGRRNSRGSGCTYHETETDETETPIAESIETRVATAEPTEASTADPVIPAATEPPIEETYAPVVVVHATRWFKDNIDTLQTFNNCHCDPLDFQIKDAVGNIYGPGEDQGQKLSSLDYFLMGSATSGCITLTALPIWKRGEPPPLVPSSVWMALPPLAETASQSWRRASVVRTGGGAFGLWHAACGLCGTVA